MSKRAFSKIHGRSLTDRNKSSIPKWTAKVFP